MTPNALEETRLWSEIAFPRRGRPNVEPGDRLVLYAAQHQRAFAVVEVTTDPSLRDAAADERWPWRVGVIPLLIVPNVRAGVRLEAVGIRPASIKQRSHLRLDHDQYNAFVDGLARTARLP